MNLTYQQRGRAREEIIQRISEHENALQYMITLQTKLKPAERCSVREFQIMNLSEQYRHFQNRLNCEVFGVRAKRKPKTYCVLSIPVIEGFDKSSHGFHTLHYHVAIGNIPKDCKQVELECWVRDAWRRTRYGTTDVDFKIVRDDHKTYITKEVLTNEGSGIDWLNVSVPIISL